MSREETIWKVHMLYHYEVLRLSGLDTIEALNEAWKARPDGVQGMPMGLATKPAAPCFLLIVETRKGHRVPMSRDAAYILGTHWIRVIGLVDLYELYHPVCAIGGFHVHPVCSFSLNEHGLTTS